MIHRVSGFLLLVLLLTAVDHLQATSDRSLVEQAIAKCRTKLAQDPTFPPAQFLLGKLLQSLPGSNNLAEIAKLSWQAGSCDDRPLDNSQRIEALYRAATSYRELGDDTHSATLFVEVLAWIPDQASMEELLQECTALLVSQVRSSSSSSSSNNSINSSNNLEETFSTQLAQRAKDLTLQFPKSVLAWQFQGAISRKLGNIEVAYQSYHEAAEAAAEAMATAWNSSGEGSSRLEMVVESNILASAAARLAGQPIDVQMMYLERAYGQSTAAGDTIEDFRRQRCQAEILTQMGTVQKAAGDAQAAIRFFQQALQLKPGDGHALAQLASLSALPSESVQHLEEDYIRDLFDGYASRFEEELVTILDYKGYAWVADEVSEAWTSITQDCGPSGPYTIVDVGCGTGLVGDYMVQNLNLPCRVLGVDLSERMVKLAAARDTADGVKIYESVHQGDALTFLHQLPKGSTHAIVAADVFIYIGNLEAIFQSSRLALAVSGVVVFSVEQSSEEQGMVLLPSGRFGHSKEYIEAEATKAGFVVRVWKEGVLRKQRGENVLGAVVVLEKKIEKIQGHDASRESTRPRR